MHYSWPEGPAAEGRIASARRWLCRLFFTSACWPSLRDFVSKRTWSVHCPPCRSLWSLHPCQKQKSNRAWKRPSRLPNPSSLRLFPFLRNLWRRRRCSRSRLLYRRRRRPLLLHRLPLLRLRRPFSRRLLRGDSADRRRRDSRFPRVPVALTPRWSSRASVLLARIETTA